MARLVIICNPFEAVKSRKVIDLNGGETVQELIDTYITKDKLIGIDLNVSINGEHVTDYSREVSVFDVIGICPVPHGGGGGKSIARVVGMIALAVVAPQIAGMMPGFGAAGVAGAGGAAGWGVAFSNGIYSTSILGSLATAGIMVAGALLINAILPASLPNVSSESSTSATYSFEPINNTTREGVALPIVYGTTKIVPPIISEYISQDGDKQYYNALYAIAGHKIEGITDIRINEQKLSVYSDIDVQIREGDIDQSPIPGFSDVKVDNTVGIPLNYGTPIIRETTGNLLDGFGVGILFPGGLYYVSDSGALTNTSVKYSIKYRLKGSGGAYTSIMGDETILSTPITTVSSNIQLYSQYSQAGLSKYVATKVYSVTSSTSNTLTLTLGDGVNSSQLPYLTSVDISNDNGATWQRVHTPTYSGEYVLKHRDGPRYFNSNAPSAKSRTITVQTSATTNATRLIRLVCSYVYDFSGSVPPNIPTTVNLLSVQYRGLADYITVTSNSQEAFRKFYKVSGLQPNAYEIKVELYEEPNSGNRYSNAVQWEYYQELTSGDEFTYPGVALVAVKALATDQLSGSRPSFSCVVSRGANTLGGQSNNPAWACYDLLIQKYGGGVSADRLLYDRFVDWADYCDEKGYECNLVLDTTYGLNDWLSVISKLGWGNVIQFGTNFGCIVDKPESLPIQRFMFNMGNILTDSYKEEYMSNSDRANAIELTYYDIDLGYERQTVELHQHDFDTTGEEIRKTSVDLIGCVNRNQAIAFGKRLLNCNRYLTLTASWSADIDSLACTVGDVVDVSHDVPMYGTSGRIVEVFDNSTIKLDREITFTAGLNYAFKIKYNDDTTEEVMVTNTGLTTSILNLATPLSSTPNIYDLYVFGEVDKLTKSFRIIDISRDNSQLRTVSAIEYASEVYNEDANVPVISPTYIVGVKDLILTSVYQPSTDGSGDNKIACNWLGNSLYWDIYYRVKGSGVWTYYERTYTQNSLISGGISSPNTYEVSVTVDGNSPDSGVIAETSITGAFALPNDVTGLQLWQRNSVVYMRWNHNTTLGTHGYEVRVGTDWENGQVIIDRVQENSASWLPPQSGTYNILVKALNNALQYSANAANAQITVDIETSLNFIVNRNEIPTHVVDSPYMKNLYMDYDTDKLVWIPSLDDIAYASELFDDSDWAGYKGDGDNGSYYSEVLDLNRVVDILGVRLNAGIETSLIPARTTVGDLATRTPSTYPLDSCTSLTSTANYVGYYRHGITEETMTDWIMWTGVADFQARYVQFRVDTAIDIPSTSFAFNSVQVMLDVQTQSKSVYNQAISSSGTTINLADIPFEYTLQYNVTTTVLGNTAAYCSVVINADSFTVYMFDTSGALISGNINIEIKGV